MLTGRCHIAFETCALASSWFFCFFFRNDWRRSAELSSALLSKSRSQLAT